MPGDVVQDGPKRSGGRCALAQDPCASTGTPCRQRMVGTESAEQGPKSLLEGRPRVPGADGPRGRAGSEGGGGAATEPFWGGNPAAALLGTPVLACAPMGSLPRGPGHEPTPVVLR